MQGIQQQYLQDSLQRFSLSLHLSQPLFNAPHTGSLLHGLFGHGLLRAACHCAAPHNAHDPACVYQQIFSPSAPTDWPLRFNDCPPAYVITPAEISHQPRARLDFQLTLLGPALQHSDLIWRSWQMAALRGVGPRQASARFTRQAVPQALALTNTAWQGTLRLVLNAPLLIKKRFAPGQPSLALSPESLTLTDLLTALHRRLQLTHALYQVPYTAPAPLAQWLADAEHLNLHSQLKRCHFARRSNRQQQRIPLTGLLGTLELTGHFSAALLNALLIGQWLHIGGKSALGFGAYTIEFCE